MSLIEIAGGFVAGVITGVGISVFYLRWKVKRQLGAMQGQMEEMMDMTQGLGDEMHEEPGEVKEVSDEKED